MRKIGTLALLTLALVFLGSCTLCDTGTLWIYNHLDHTDELATITALYVFPTGSADMGDSIISSPLAHDDREVQYYVDPGNTTIHAVLGGSYAGSTATKTMLVEADTVYPLVYITDSDLD